MYHHEEPWKNCPISMLYNIAESDNVYDKCHHLLNPFKSNETSHDYKMNLSTSSSGLLGVVLFILIQILIKRPVSKQ